MRANSPVHRLATSAAVAAVMIGAIAPAWSPARAQTQPFPTSEPQSQGDTQAVDPPARVGRVARIAGTVSFHTADADHWEPATANYPVTSGNAFWTQPGASADLDIDNSLVALDQSTEFTFDTLGDQTMQATAAQGRVYLRLRSLAPGETASLRTPRGTVSFTEPGRYGITVGDVDHPTLVTVVEGAAAISGPGVDVRLGARQSAEITGTDSFNAIVVAEVPDPFLSEQLARDRPVVVSDLSPPPVVQQMTGYEAVANVGEWQQAPDYGRVWYPPVDRDWVPYRHGHWSWVAPWGWTWVDDAAWGFAPFHYGRWVEINDRWAWTPVEPGVVVVERPVYAPALVSFLGVAAGVAIGVGIGAAVGWIPLGPREVYRPPYRVSNSYIRNVNVMNVRNVTNISNVNVTNVHYVNNRAATVVAAQAMQRSQAVAGQVRPVAANQLASFRPVDRPVVQPTLATRGVTPGVARSLNLQAPPGGSTPLQPTSPGPSFRPGQANPALASGRVGPSAGPSAAGPSSAGLAAGAVVGGAAAVGGAALLSRPARPGPVGLPPIAPRGPAAVQAAPGGAPGPAIVPRGPGGFQGGGQGSRPAIPVPNAGQPQVQRPAAPVSQQPQFQRPAAPAPQPQFQRPAAPAPQPQFQRPAAPAPQPQFQRPAAPAPQPQFQRPAAPAPQPQFQRPAAPAPQPQIQRAEPPPRPAAPPRQEPPAAHRQCPPGRPSC